MKKALVISLIITALGLIHTTAWADKTITETPQAPETYEVVTLQSLTPMCNWNGEKIASIPDYTLLSVIEDSGDKLYVRWNDIEGWISSDTEISLLPRRGVIAIEWQWASEGDWRLHTEIEREVVRIEQTTAEGFDVVPEEYLEMKPFEPFEVSKEDLTGDFIYVDISLQCLIIYKDYKASMVGAVVTGYKDRYDTPKGIYRVEQHILGYTLRGEEEGKSYEAWVQYWISFSGGYGIHDADGWRSVYGHNAYEIKGSHGCVNTLRSFTKQVFENCELGTLVVVN